MAYKSPWTKRIYRFNEELRREWVSKQAESLTAGSRVLDAGAGSGQYRRFFDHCDYKSQDFGQELGTIGNYTELDYECDITEIPAEDGSFDAILCTEVIEHVPQPERVITEFARLLRPGGTLILSAPLGAFLHQEPYHFYGGFTPHWYEKYLKENGFTIESIEPNGGFFRLLGQELRRFCGLCSPRSIFKKGLIKGLGATVIWICMLPASFLFPVFAPWLDSFCLDSTITIGYHVVAFKNK